MKEKIDPTHARSSRFLVLVIRAFLTPDTDIQAFILAGTPLAKSGDI